MQRPDDVPVTQAATGRWETATSTAMKRRMVLMMFTGGHHHHRHHDHRSTEPRETAADERSRSQL